MATHHPPTHSSHLGSVNPTASLSSRDTIPMVHSPHNNSILLVGEDRRPIKLRDKDTRIRRSRRVAGFGSNPPARSVNGFRLRWIMEGFFRVGWDTNSNLSHSYTAPRTGTTRPGVCQINYRSRRRTSKRGSQVLDTYRNLTHTPLSGKHPGTDNNNHNNNRSNRSSSRMAARVAED